MTYYPKDETADALRVDDRAAKLAASDGLDWNEVCGLEVEDGGDCGSGTCVAAHYEDHDPDVARTNYRKWARVALSDRAAERSGERSNLIRIARAIGCVAADDVSDEFLALIPREVELIVQRYERVIEEKGAVIAACGGQFRFYEKSHRAKGTDDATAKAVVNDQMATMCEHAIADRTNLVAKAEGERDAAWKVLRQIAKVADEPRKDWSRVVGDLARAALPAERQSDGGGEA